MDAILRKKINELAYDILQAYNIGAPIHNIDSIVKKIGGTIEEVDSLGIFSDGRVMKKENRFTIYVPKHQPLQRRNFTIAHELGHLFIHMGYMIDDELWNNSDGVTFDRFGNSEGELQANEFAAAFLMPEDKYKEVMEENSEGNEVYISKVAEYFHVSIDAAAYRGKWLGLLQW